MNTSEIIGKAQDEVYKNLKTINSDIQMIDVACRKAIKLAQEELIKEIKNGIYNEKNNQFKWNLGATFRKLEEIFKSTRGIK